MDEYSPIVEMKEVAKTEVKKHIFRFLLPIFGVMFISILVILLLILVTNSSNNKYSGYGYSWTGEISEIGLQDIPNEFLAIYQDAEEIYGVPWNILAAIHKVETDFSRNVTVSSAGAIGHMQFMPKTWVGWNYPSNTIPNNILKSLVMIAKYGGYGVDANGDGYADPWDVEDAIHAAANYLSANGASTGDFKKAIYAYNHADWYVQIVLDLADSYVVSKSISLDVEYTGNDIADIGIQWIGRSTYVFGGGRTASDVAKGRFDCSSFVYWSFEQNGISLGSRGSVSTQTLNKLGEKISIEEAEPGDLIFFDTYQKDGHVVIYMGDYKAIGCQESTNGVGIIDMTTTYWRSVFKGHVRRI